MHIHTRSSRNREFSWKYCHCDYKLVIINHVDLSQSPKMRDRDKPHTPDTTYAMRSIFNKRTTIDNNDMKELIFLHVKMVSLVVVVGPELKILFINVYWAVWTICLHFVHSFVCPSIILVNLLQTQIESFATQRERDKRKTLLEELVFISICTLANDLIEFTCGQLSKTNRNCWICAVSATIPFTFKSNVECWNVY